MATYRVASLGQRVGSVSVVAHPESLHQRVGSVSVVARPASLHLTVAPKYWRPPQTNARQWSVMASGSYTVHEGDFITVVPSDDSPEARQVHQAIVEKLDALARHTDDVEQAEDADEGATTSAQSAKRSHAGLIRRVAGRSNAMSLPKDADPHASQALLALMLLEERLQHRSPVSGAAQLGDDGNAAATTAATTSPVAAVIAAWRFVHELGKHVRQLRYDYSPTEIVTASPRGRILARGFLRHAVTGLPALDCEVDAFSPIVPLAQVFAAALEVLAGGWDTRLGTFRHVALVRNILADAANLRRHLHGIPAPRREEAARIASLLRLPPMQRAFSAALADARTILHDDAPGVSVGAADGTSAFVLWFDTAMLWEALLVRAAESRDGWQVDWNAGGKASHVKSASPWLGLAQGQPDIVGVAEDRAFVIDAKYKTPPETPSAADKYQLFAYSHLATFHGKPMAHCLIAYAAQGDPATHRSWPRGQYSPPAEGSATSSCHLVACGFPFIHMDQALNPTLTSTYISDLGELIAAALGSTSAATNKAT